MYRGFIINLKTATSRWASITRELEKIGAAPLYQRVEAVLGREVASQYSTTLEPGNLGLWLTHLNIVREQRKSETHLHIVEDDTIFANDALLRFNEVLSQADSAVPDWDLIFTDICPYYDVIAFNSFSAGVESFHRTGQISLLSLGRMLFCATSSIFIRRRSIEKYLRLMEGGWASNLPIDFFLRNLVIGGKLNAYVTLPFLTSVSSEAMQSSIKEKFDEDLRGLFVYRRALFKEADLDKLNAELDKLVNHVRPSVLASIYFKALLFIMGNRDKTPL